MKLTVTLYSELVGGMENLGSYATWIFHVSSNNDIHIFFSDYTVQSFLLFVKIKIFFINV